MWRGIAAIMQTRAGSTRKAWPYLASWGTGGEWQLSSTILAKSRNMRVIVRRRSHSTPRAWRSDTTWRTGGASGTPSRDSQTWLSYKETTRSHGSCTNRAWQWSSMSRTEAEFRPDWRVLRDWRLLTTDSNELCDWRARLRSYASRSVVRGGPQKKSCFGSGCSRPSTG